MTDKNPPMSINPAGALPAPVIDVPTPGGWVILVRPVSARQWPEHEGKFIAEYWEAAASPVGDQLESGGDVVVADAQKDDTAKAIGLEEAAEEIIRRHHEVALPDGTPIFHDTIRSAASSSILESQDRGAVLSKPLCDYVLLLATEADKLREGLPPWADVVFKRDVLDAVQAIGGKDAQVSFVEEPAKGRMVRVELVYRNEHYDVGYRVDPDHERDRQEVILQAIHSLPARAAAETPAG